MVMCPAILDITSSRLLVFYFDVTEEQTHCRAAWTQETFHDDSEELLHDSTVDFQQGQARCNTPDVSEGDFSKETSPVECSRNGTKESEDHVEKILSSFEAFVCTFPHTISTVGSLRLCEAIFECDL